MQPEEFTANRRGDVILCARPPKHPFTQMTLLSYITWYFFFSYSISLDIRIKKDINFVTRTIQSFIIQLDIVSEIYISRIHTYIYHHHQISHLLSIEPTKEKQNGFITIPPSNNPPLHHISPNYIERFITSSTILSSSIILNILHSTGIERK